MKKAVTITIVIFIIGLIAIAMFEYKEEIKDKYDSFKIKQLEKQQLKEETNVRNQGSNITSPEEVLVNQLSNFLPILIVGFVIMTIMGIIFTIFGRATRGYM